MVSGVCVVPLDVLRELVTKEVVSHTDGAAPTIPTPKKTMIPTNPKVRYIDAMIIGAVIGVVGIVIAEKQGWIAEPDSKYKLYGAGVGAIAAGYIVYRTNNAKPRVQIVKKQTEE